MSQSPRNKDDRGEGAPKGNGGPSGQGNRKRFWDKTFTVTLSLSKLVFGSVFSVFLLVWIFIFGIMLGRGHNPEEVVPELARVMPSPVPQAETDAAGIMDTVLQTRELQYHESLKAKDPPSPAPSAQSPQTRMETPTANASATPAAGKTPAKLTTQTAPDKDNSGQGQTVYDYIYQVAAFNNVAAANTMQKRLRDGGFSARIAQSMSNGVTWYRILVSFKGTVDDTRTLKTKLTAFGIPNVILRGKTPVN